MPFYRYVDQGGGKRKGAFAIYLEPWHADIMDWLDLRKNHGKEEVGKSQQRETETERCVYVYTLDGWFWSARFALRCRCILPVCNII
jgi:hypothetical protein